MGKVIHFEITADDVARAREFYKIFGWQFTDASMPGMEYWLAKTGEEGAPGIDGAIMPREYSKAPVRNTIDVDNIDEMVETVKGAGGTIDGDIQDIPTVGRFVTGHDTEGNEFGMLQAA